MIDMKIEIPENATISLTQKDSSQNSLCIEFGTTCFELFISDKKLKKLQSELDDYYGRSDLLDHYGKRPKTK